MRRILFILLFTALLGIAAGEQLEVRKAANPEEISVGDEVIMSLEFTNPFNQEIDIRIVDQNVFADNGLDIECLDRSLPFDPLIALE
ncbi:MAG: hypothetical protein KKB85_00620, partial [Candidatus Altiarchaeota archaeon]|nr:hypothetical protein [Candidatus Altiarchaeota archaeon]